MKVYKIASDKTITPLYTGGPTAVTIGIYDGIHLAHRAIIETLVKKSRAKDYAACCITFDKHPAYLLDPENAPGMLSDFETKCEILESLGIDNLFVITFDKKRSLESPEDFVNELLKDALQTRYVIVGENFRFGHNRKGDAALLTSLGKAAQFETEIYPTLKVQDIAISSTYIRGLIEQGNIELANQYLSRQYRISGTVVKGDKRGRELGYPTANIEPDYEFKWPKYGIYAAFATIGADPITYKAAVSIGIRPTFYKEEKPVIEAYLLDFDKNIYDEKIRLYFIKRLRDEIAFESTDALLVQLVKDVEQCDEILTNIKSWQFLK
jgi:riboflavin kinase/FMN adenylyltransferase